MIHFKFKADDGRYVYISPDTELEYQFLHVNVLEHFCPFNPACFRKGYRGTPYREEFIWEYTRHDGSHIFYAAIGMTSLIYAFLTSNGYECDGVKENPQMFRRKLEHSFDEFKAIVDSWGLTNDKGEPLTPRPYQYETAYEILQRKKCLAELATRAGKTLVAYMIFRYAITYLGAKHILMVVPAIELVNQGDADFNTYGKFFEIECIWSKGKLNEDANITIGTYQSLIKFLDPKDKKYNPHFFDKYDVLFVDETHKATAKSTATIISQPFMVNVKVGFGLTGTMPADGSIEWYGLHSLLGAKIKEIRADYLMEEGYISKLKIFQHRLSYADTLKQTKLWCNCAEYSLADFVTVPNPKNPKKPNRVPLENPKFLIAYQKNIPPYIIKAREKIFASNQMSDEKKWSTYKEYLADIVKDSVKANAQHIEMMMVHFFESRIDYLIEQIKNCPNNTLVLAFHVEYIKHITDRLREAFPDRPVVGVWAGSKERKNAKTVFKEHNNAIMVANYGIMGTGITLSNLCYGFLFESFKSDSLNTQSIGRGLGLSDLKEYYTLHDITDCFDTDAASNKLFLQGIARTRIYKKRNYQYSVIKAEI